MARVGVEELVGDIGEDGGAARGDAALGNEGQEPREKLVNADRGLQFGKFGEEFGGEVFRVTMALLGGARVG
jgi:hypothetical protein